MDRSRQGLGSHVILEAIIFAFCITVAVGILGCGPTAPPAQTPGQSQPSLSAASTPSTTPPSVAPASSFVELLEKMPLPFKKRGIWFGDNKRALDLADAPQPKSVEEIRALSEAELEGYLNALGDVVPVADFGRFRGQTQEWKETFGFDYFGIARGVRTGARTLSPHKLAYVEGNFDPATVRQMLLALGYESLETAGLAYYAAPQGFHKLDNPASRLSLNSMDHVFIGDGVLMAAKASDMLTDALKVRAGTAPSLTDDPSVLGIASSLEDPLSAVIFTRLSVLEPGHLPALFYDKPTDWGTLNEWELFAAGYGVSGTDRLLTISLYYADPNHAAEDAG